MSAARRSKTIRRLPRGVVTSRCPSAFLSCTSQLQPLTPRPIAPLVQRVASTPRTKSTAWPCCCASQARPSMPFQNISDPCAIRQVWSRRVSSWRSYSSVIPMAPCSACAVAAIQAGCLAAAGLGHGCAEPVRLQALAGKSQFGCHNGSGDLLRHHAQLVLNGLVIADRAPEL